MNANFFGQLAQLDITGTVQITVAKTAENNLVVSTIVNNENCGDKAKELIMPLILRGTASEMDEGYFEHIRVPMQEASGLMINMEAHMKQLEEAKRHSAMEKGKADKEKKARDERDKKYKDAMQKAADFEKEGRYRDAWAKVPEPSQFPEHAEAIRKRKTELSNKFAPDLFAASDPSIVTTAPQTLPRLIEDESFADQGLCNEQDNDDAEGKDTIAM